MATHARWIAVDIDADVVVPDGNVGLRRGHTAFMPITAVFAAHGVARHAVGDDAAVVVVAVVVALGATAEGKQQTDKQKAVHACLRA